MESGDLAAHMAANDPVRVVRSERDGAMEEIEGLRRELEWVRRELTTARDVNRGDVWYWQDDGGNYLETLVCPVVIRPDELMAITEAANRTVSLERAAARVAGEASPFRSTTPGASRLVWIVQDPAMQALEDAVMTRGPHDHDGGPVRKGVAHAADDRLARWLAKDTVQSLADSDPDEDTIGAQEELDGTPYQGMFAISGARLEELIFVALSNALCDEVLARGPTWVADEPTDATRLQRLMEGGWAFSLCPQPNGRYMVGVDAQFGEATGVTGARTVSNLVEALPTAMALVDELVARHGLLATK